MANKFNTAEFLRGAYYSPIKVGAHNITFGKIKINIEYDDERDRDTSYLLVPMQFSNGRVIETRFYGTGAKIFCDQLRRQLEDETDYKKTTDFLKTLEGKEVSVWVSQRTYPAADGTVKTTLQYDFAEPTAVDTGVSDEEGPF